MTELLGRETLGYLCVFLLLSPAVSHCKMLTFTLVTMGRNCWLVRGVWSLAEPLQNIRRVGTTTRWMSTQHVKSNSLKAQSQKYHYREGLESTADASSVGCGLKHLLTPLGSIGGHWGPWTTAV